MKSVVVAFLAAAVFMVGCGKRGDEKSGGVKTVVQYDAIPNYSNWGGVTEAYFKKTGVRVPLDMKGSSAAMEYDHVAWVRQLERENVDAIFTEPLRTGWWTTGVKSLPALEKRRAKNTRVAVESSPRLSRA